MTDPGVPAVITASLLQYGILGIFAGLMLILVRTLLKREQERSDTLAAEVTRLNTLIQDKAIPALVLATSAITESQRLLQAIQYQRDVENASDR